MTNREKWLSYTSGLSSPDNYIEWGWRYIIAASLQRRVWIGVDNQQLFPNQYNILTGPPGTGKGLVIKEVSYFLRYWKLKDAIKLSFDDAQAQETANVVAEADLQDAQSKELQPANKKNDYVEPFLIPMAADATTYEALVSAVAESYRRISYKVEDKTTGKIKPGTYGHSSICFALQELASLLRKRTDDTVNYMLGLYDCPVDYEYKTKTQGVDRVRRGCLNLLAGTTPSFMQSIFNDKLIDEGFSSRTFFIYAPRNRKFQFFAPPLTTEQKQHRAELLNHIRVLTSLYGEIKVSPETRKWLEEWWVDYNERVIPTTNISSKLIAFVARLNIHVMKVAIAEHFSERTDLDIPLEAYQRAIAILEKEMKNMALAINMEGTNPVAKLAKRIVDILMTGKKNFVELHVDTFSMGDKDQLTKALDFLTETKQIKTSQVKDTDTDLEVIYYELKKQ